MLVNLRNGLEELEVLHNQAHKCLQSISASSTFTQDQAYLAEYERLCKESRELFHKLFFMDTGHVNGWDKIKMVFNHSQTTGYEYALEQIKKGA